MEDTQEERQGLPTLGREDMQVMIYRPSAQEACRVKVRVYRPPAGKSCRVTVMIYRPSAQVAMQSKGQDLSATGREGMQDEHGQTHRLGGKLQKL